MVANRLLKTTAGIQKRFEELERLIAAPEIIADNNLYRRLVLERASLEEAALCRKELEQAVYELETLKIPSTNDAELKNLINAEIKRLKATIGELSQNLKGLVAEMIKAEGSVTLEIRGEGEAAALFAARLLGFYRALADCRGYIIGEQRLFAESSEGAKGGAITLSGAGAYEALKYENGIHKAVGINAGATVIALKSEPRKSVEISDKDLRIDLFHSGGAGGQNVNKVETAVRITHLPTGVVVTCQDERSQLKNKERALETLRERLEELNKKQSEVSYAKRKKEALSAAKKAGRIRIYDFSCGIITDSRSGISITVEDAERGGIADLCGHLPLTDN